MSQLVRTAPSAGSITPSPAQSVPSTPAGQKAQEGTPKGSWKHPQFDEITRRQYATNFDERNVKIIFANGALLLLCAIAPSVISQISLLGTLTKSLFALLHSVPYHEWIVLTFRLILIVNIFVALLPLARRYYPDDIADIPLTPSQRHIMGLKADVATPQTPGSAYASPNYVTPPRYQKSTPRGSFSGPGDRGSPSPLSRSPRASIAKSTSNSPFGSPNTGSPLFQKAVSGGSATKRLSYGGSPLGSSLFGDSSPNMLPGTPTPGTGKASVGLNNKWLYEKRRESPRTSLFS